MWLIGLEVTEPFLSWARASCESQICRTLDYLLCPAAFIESLCSLGKLARAICQILQIWKHLLKQQVGHFLIEHEPGMRAG